MKMTNVTDATVMYAIFAMDAYEHNPNDGSWSQDLTKFSPISRMVCSEITLATTLEVLMADHATGAAI